MLLVKVVTVKINLLHFTYSLYEIIHCLNLFLEDNTK